MCGRYTLRTPTRELARVFELPAEPPLPPRYNIAPTQPVAAVLVVTGERQMRLMRWGLVPHWAKDLRIAGRLINARAETLADKPAFRTALRQRRCLVLADGFYEWRHQGKAKQPHYITMKDNSPFAFAGLWDRWQPPGGGEAVESCTIITTESSALVRPIHDRMPVILDPADVDLWLDPAVTDPVALLPLLRPFPAERMQAYPVSDVVNSPAHESRECIEPLTDQER